MDAVCSTSALHIKEKFIRKMFLWDIQVFGEKSWEGGETNNSVTQTPSQHNSDATQTAAVQWLVTVSER